MKLFENMYQVDLAYLLGGIAKVGESKKLTLGQCILVHSLSVSFIPLHYTTYREGGETGRRSCITTALVPAMTDSYLSGLGNRILDSDETLLYGGHRPAGL